MKVLVGGCQIGFESSPNSLTCSVSLASDVLTFAGMLCVGAIVEHRYIVVRHHIVDETDVYVLPPAVGIAQARIDFPGCDLRLADAASMLTDLIREYLRTSANHCSKTDDPQRSRHT